MTTTRQMVRLMSGRREHDESWLWTSGALALLANAPSALRWGWHEPVLDARLLAAAQVAALGAYVALMLVYALRAGGERSRRDALEQFGRLELCACALGLALSFTTWGPPACALAALFGRGLRVFLRLVQSALPPGLVFVGSFLLLVVAGTGLLMLPAATPRGQPISLVDAAFTITSAISQTGLTVRDTGEGFTRLGQIVILLWIQAGALGVLVFGALLASVLGSSFGLRATQALMEGSDQSWAGQLAMRRLVVFIVVATHGLEAAGAAALYVWWPESWLGAPEMESALDRVYHCVFFSVSAFCNAGFSTTANSLAGLRTHWTSHVVICGLIVIGSIGFPVLDNLRRVAWARLRGVRMRDGALVRLSLNTKIVLSATALVYAAGYVVVLLGELTQTTEGAGLAALDAHFMTVNRTSGFNTIEPGSMGALSLLMIMLLMFIGGAPGSVAGGIKLMVFAILALTVWSTITGRGETRAFGRTIPDALVRKSAALIVVFLALIMAVTGVLAATEGGPEGMPFEALLFDAVSACATTGYSMGVPGESSPAGKIALSVGMFVGRVGPLAFLGALVTAARARRPRYEYPTESVVIY